MNVGIVTTWFERGAGYVSRAYMQALSEKHNVFIYARAGEKYAMDDPNWNLDCVTWGRRIPHRVDTYIQWSEMKHWIESHQLDCILFNEQQSWQIIVQLRHYLKIKRKRLLLGAYVDYYTADTIPFFWLYDFLFCNTKRHYSVFKDHPRCFYIPWGTDISLFHPLSHGKVVQRPLTFFHSCGMDPFRKGTALVVQAFLELCGDANLVLHSQVKLEEETEAVINRDPRIKLIIKEISAPGLYFMGDVYVYPSRLEGIGLTIAEAMACGLPVIATDNPPMNEWILDQVNGKLVDVTEFKRREDGYYWPESIVDVQSLRNAMQWYLDNANGKEEWKKVTRRYAQEHLNWDYNGQVISELIEGVGEGFKTWDKKLLKTALHYEQSRYGGAIRHALVEMGAPVIRRKLRSLVGRSKC